MKIIKTPDTYQCEVCGSIHNVKEVAEYCESYILPECKVNIGDKVFVETRYDGYQLRKVIDIEIHGTHDQHYFNSVAEWNEYIDRWPATEMHRCILVLDSV